MALRSDDVTDPYEFQTDDYRVCWHAGYEGFHDSFQYRVVNKLTGVIEVETSQLPNAVAVCVNLQLGLDDIRSGALPRRLRAMHEQAAIATDFATAQEGPDTRQ